jgi:hypothetical protein
MDEYSDIWIEPCDAARDIRDAWGTNKALGYQIGEKFLNDLRAADSSSDWREKIPLFTEAIKRIFTVEELKTYFATTRRVGSAAHVRPTASTNSCARLACSTTT